MFLMGSEGIGKSWFIKNNVHNYDNELTQVKLKLIIQASYLLTQNYSF
jgi:hypothetical protein